MGGGRVQVSEEPSTTTDVPFCKGRIIAYFCQAVMKASATVIVQDLEIESASEMRTSTHSIRTNIVKSASTNMCLIFLSGLRRFLAMQVSRKYGRSFGCRKRYLEHINEL